LEKNISVTLLVFFYAEVLTHI